MRLSVTKIRAFKSCRRQYELRYIEGLIPTMTPDALQTGRNYHAKIEQLYTDGEIEQDNTKESAMVTAYAKYIKPRFEMQECEVLVEKNLGGEDVLQGIADGVTVDGMLVEHKTTSEDITPAYEYNLQWDEQIFAYMLMTGARKVWYTVIKKPTIRQKKTETAEEFFDRMVAWYDVDTDKKVAVLEITRTDEEVEAYAKEVMQMLDEMKNAKYLYRNPSWCKRWGRMCEYAQICLTYDPTQEYIEFTRKEYKDGCNNND